MKKLIQTTFVYAQEFDGFRPNQGSYLGKKPASERTIRRFLIRNAKTNHVPHKILSIVITGSHESRWISK